MAGHDPTYVFDSSSWLQIEGHPDANRILDAVGSLVEKGRVKSPPEVFAELKSVNAVSGWIDLNKKQIIENRSASIDYLMTVGRVTHAFPAMVGARGRKNKADPYVVALAACGSANPGKWAVVCDETLDRRPSRKIPTACKAFGVEAMTLREVLQREFPNDGW